MADIILYNDQDQEETISGVEKLVVRSESGDVEFVPPITLEAGKVVIIHKGDLSLSMNQMN